MRRTRLGGEEAVGRAGSVTPSQRLVTFSVNTLFRCARLAGGAAGRRAGEQVGKCGSEM
jgi:hypothetical protein